MTEALPLHKRIRQERRVRDWTQAQLATLLGVHPTIVQKIEGGKLAPSKTIIPQLKALLGIPYAAFFESDGPPAP